MNAFIWAANILGWPVIHLGMGSVASRLPSTMFSRDSWMTAPRRWERGGRLYRDVLAIRRWKSMLPDGAPMLGGFAKKKIITRSPLYLAQFIAETRRSELAHWCMLFCLPLFFFWNPPWACWVMTAYATAANIPCILAQRYNRLVLKHMLRTRRLTPDRP